MSRTIQKPSDFPHGEHWAILELRTFSIPGDERSRTNPGHGYPESTETVVNYEVFRTKDDFTTEFNQRIQSPYNRDKIIGLHVSATYGIKIVVQMSISKDEPQGHL